MNEQNNINRVENLNSKEMPMKWYKALIYFFLFASAVISLYSGFNMLTGKYYGDATARDLAYSTLPALKPIDIIMGICYIILSIFSIITRQALKNFSKLGPTFLYVLYACNIVLSLVYIIAVAKITGMNLNRSEVSSYFSSISMSGVMLGANITYFTKRKHLFINGLKLL